MCAWQITLDRSRRIDVYETHREFTFSKVERSEVVHNETFNKTWREEFPHVKLRQQKTTLSKCRTCEDLDVSVRLYEACLL